MSDEDYFAVEAVSQSSLKQFHQNPIKYQSMYVLNEHQQEPTAAMNFGHLFHEMAAHDFEMSGFCCVPDRFEGFKVPEKARTGNWVLPPKDVVTANSGRRGKKYLEWKKSLAADTQVAPKEWDLDLISEYLAWEKSLSSGAKIISARDYATLEKMIFHPYLEPILQQSVDNREKVFLWDDVATGLPCKAKLDVVVPPTADKRGVVVDWKTTTSLSRFDISRDIRKYRYYWQACWYSQAFEEVFGEPPFFLFCFVDKSGFGFQLVDCSEWIPIAKNEIRQTLYELARFDFDKFLIQPPLQISPPNFLKEAKNE